MDISIKYVKHIFQCVILNIYYEIIKTIIIKFKNVQLIITE